MDNSCKQVLAGAEFSADGLDAMQIQERMFEAYLRANTLRTLCSYGVAIVFALAGFSLIMFGPPGRENTIIVFSVSFILMSAGIAGFTQFRARGFGLELAAAQQTTAGRTTPKTKATTKGKLSNLSRA